MTSSRGVLFRFLKEEIEDGRLAIQVFGIKEHQTLDEDLKCIRGHLGRSSSGGGNTTFVEKIKRFIVDAVKPELPKVYEIAWNAPSLVKLAKQNLVAHGGVRGLDTLLLVLPKAVGVPGLGPIGPEELADLIRDAEYFRCMEASEAKRLVNDDAYNVKLPENAFCQRLVQVVLGTPYNGYMSRTSLSQGIRAGKWKAQVLSVRDISPSVSLPKFMC